MSDLIAAEHRRQERQYREELARAEYERCHPDDSFEYLKRRAQFTKEDKGLLRDWCAVAERRDRMRIARIMSVAAE